MSHNLKPKITLEAKVLEPVNQVIKFQDFRFSCSKVRWIKYITDLETKKIYQTTTFDNFWQYHKKCFGQIFQVSLR